MGTPRSNSTSLSRILRIVTATVTALAVAVGVSPQTSQASTVADASRSTWSMFAQRQLWKMEVDTTSSSTHAAFTLSYQAQLSAAFYGWKDLRTQRLAQAALRLAKPDGGYGLEVEWTPFAGLPGARPIPVATSYTVTTSEHVGPMLLEGYKAGVISTAPIIASVRSLVNTPISSTPNGDCMAYNNSGFNNASQVGCVINVTMGAAAYLKRAMASGALDSEPVMKDLAKQTVTRLMPLGLKTYNESAGGWTYLLTTSGVKLSSSPVVQDWSHNAYTFESGVTLYGLSRMQRGIQNALTRPVYGDGSQGNGATGRLRLQALVPDMLNVNDWRDAVAGELYVARVTNNRLAHAQLGMWALRMSRVAVAPTTNWRKSSTIALVKMTDSTGTQVTRFATGKTYRLTWSVVSSNGTPNVYQPVALQVLVSGTYRTVQSTPTSTVGQVTFEFSTRSSVCFRALIQGVYTTSGSDLLSGRCVQVG